MNSLDQLRPAIESTRFHLALGMITKAEETCRQKILPLIRFSRFDESFQESYPILDDDLLELLQECKEKREFAITKLLLSRFLIKVVNVYHHSDSEKHLTKLINLGGIVKSFDPEKWFNSVKIDLMNQVLEEMQKIEDVNLRKKAVAVATFLLDIGETLGQGFVGKCSESCALYSQAIMLLQTVCGKTAEHQRILADCYYNLGKMHKKQLAVSKAKKNLRKAIEIYHSARDLSNEAKEKNMQMASDELKDIECKSVIIRFCFFLVIISSIAVITNWLWNAITKIMIEPQVLHDSHFP